MAEFNSIDPDDDDDQLDDDDDDDIDDEEQEEEDEDEEDEDGKLRKDIANMPLMEVLELRDKIGIKLYDKAIFGGGSGVEPNSSNASVGAADRQFKRENAKRPREMSSKRRVTAFRNVYANQKLKKERFDPRFNDKCGEFDEFLYTNNYSFISDLRADEKKLLKKELKKSNSAGDTIKTERIKALLKRMENQERADAEKKMKKEKLRTLRRENMERMRQGLQPYYLKKAELKRQELVEKYERLQKSGKLNKYLTRKSKKLDAASKLHPVASSSY